VLLHCVYTLYASVSPSVYDVYVLSSNATIAETKASRRAYSVTKSIVDTVTIYKPSVIVDVPDGGVMRNCVNRPFVLTGVTRSNDVTSPVN
jgi:hypothetical protein